MPLLLVFLLAAAPRCEGLRPLRPQLYVLGGRLSMASWASEAVVSLATYKPERLLHNSVGVSQACSVLPLIWACTSVLAQESHNMTRAHRRLQLGLAAASVWSATTVVFSPIFTSAMVRTVDPVVYPLPVKLLVTLVHVCFAGFCLSDWRRSINSRPNVWRVASGVLASAPGLSSSTAEDKKDDRELSAVLSSLSVSFAAFAGLAIFAPFPLATVPSLLGKRMARAFGAWAWLSSVVLHVLKQRGEEGEQLSAASSRRLAGAVALMAASHVVLFVVRVVCESAIVYPAGMACRPAVVASLLIYLIALEAARRVRADTV